VHLHLRNDSESFHPVHPLIRAFGPRVLHQGKGRGPRLMRDLEAEALSAYKTLGRFLGKLDGLVTTTRVSTGSQSYYLRYGLSAAGVEWLAREFEL